MSYYIIIRGPLGCGKSTIAKALSKAIDGKYFEVDRVLDEFGLTKDKEEGFISQKSFIKANEINQPYAEKYLKVGIPIIFDGNFYWKSQVEDLIKRLNYPVHVFTLKASLDTCIERDEQRDNSHGADAARVVYKKSTSFEIGHIIDIENKTEDDVVKEILKYVSKSKKQ